MYRTVAQLDSVMKFLSDFFPQLCTRVQLPNLSILGLPIFALRMRAGSNSNRRRVLIVGGMHARELMNPDAIVDLQLDLVTSYLNETHIRIGGRQWEALEIKVMLEALEIWMLPCANPDGREYVMKVDTLWRKNRRDNLGTPCDGVDDNRNCDIMWGVTTSSTSCSPCADTYVGSGPFSEPESLNIKHMCDTHNIDVFLDVHSFSELVLFPWGHAPTQTADPSKRFTNLATGACAPLNPPGHQEYMVPRDKLRFQTVARQIVADIRAVRGRSYTPEPIFQVYPGGATGTTSDYVYSRHIANPALHKTYGFAFETGPSDGDLANSFHPANPEPVKRDAKAGMISLMLQSICAIEFIGETLLGAPVQALRDVRDQRLTTTKSGRKMIALFERIQVPLLGIILADESLTGEAMSLLDRAQKLLRSDKSIVLARDVKRGLAFVDSLGEKVTSNRVRRELATVRKQLEKASGKGMRSVVESLLQPPAARKGRKSAQN
jgi:hypothetical protein